ncbi:unnamed protein product [Vitrella brassicaformis CCMP3155]|uniref:Nodulation protein E n=2 Tax=Vitrella brassicaformis TaxID=1169539 RepID=A0A0G4EUJ2_VITBC|nr:unnamed protein product [Vitrella brassicaformis CCMP3155]|eukprot:CEM01886.1 unnamed protein product [Vitrella brassicaformis CCMP3155]
MKLSSFILTPIGIGPLLGLIAALWTSLMDLVRTEGLDRMRRSPFQAAANAAFVDSLPLLRNARRRPLSSASSSLRMTADRANKKKVVVTGLGVLNGVGVGVDPFWSNLVAGKSGIDKVTRFDPEGMTCQVGCEILPGMFEPKDYFKDAKEVKRNDRFVHYAMAATKMAVEGAGLNPNGLEGVDKSRVGVLVGSGIGGIETLEQQKDNFMTKGHKKVSPFTIPAMILNTASGLIAIEIGAGGPNYGIASACATGAHAIGDAMRYIQNDEADIMICGGAEASITPLSFAGFNNMKAMANGWNDQPKAASRPFDAKRSGFVMGEGAGVIVIESEESAIKRGAPIICELAGYCANDDAYHITAPHPEGEGLARCLEQCLADGGVEDKSQVGYINAHGTSTPYNDKFETLAYKRVFGEEGAKKLLVSSTKSMTGHTLGAAGGIEAVVAIKALETNQVPPTINYENPDPDCDLNYVPNKAVEVSEPLEYAMSDNLGFGGHNAAVLFKRYR